MANITLNIEGDLNIYVSEEDGQPDSLYLDGMDGVPETLRIHLEADGEDDESKAEVIYAIPGAAAISMTLYEALSLALNSGGADSLELMPVSGIFIAFNSDDVIIDQSGDCYLAGPGIIFAVGFQMNAQRFGEAVHTVQIQTVRLAVLLADVDVQISLDVQCDICHKNSFQRSC